MRLALLLFAVSFAWGQGTSSTAAHIRPVAALPAHCKKASGDVVFKTTTTVGTYACTADDTWTLQTGGATPAGAAGTIQNNTAGALGDSGCVGTAGKMTCGTSGVGSIWSYVTNEAGTGTTAKLLAKVTAAGTAKLATTTDTAVPVYITLATDATAGISCTAGTTGNACLVKVGQATCTMDAAGATAGHFIVASTATNGRCMDGGATAPTSGWVIGTAQSTVGANADEVVELLSGYNAASGSASPLTTKGDTFGHSTVDARVPVGADGTVYTADSTQALGVKWANAAGTGVGRKALTATWSAISDGNLQEQTATWTGVTTADTIILGAPSGLAAGLQADARVSAADTVAIRIVNASGASITPGALTFNGTLAIYNLSGSGTINFGSIPDVSCLSSTFALTGVAAGDPLTPKWPSTLEAGLTGAMVASATDTVQVRLCNYSGASLDPASQSFGAAVAK